MSLLRGNRFADPERRKTRVPFTALDELAGRNDAGSTSIYQAPEDHGQRHKRELYQSPNRPLPAIVEEQDAGRPSDVAPDLEHETHGSDNRKMTSRPHSQALGCPRWRYLYKHKLGQRYNYVVAESRNDNPEGHKTVLLQVFPESVDQEQLKIIKNIQSSRHKNVLRAVEAFDDPEGRLVAWELMPMSLVHVSEGRFLDDTNVASILVQVIEGLCYLHQRGLEHNNLSCAAVLINYDGVVKIGGLDDCQRLSSDKNFAKDLRRLTMELVNGHYQENSNSGIKNKLNMPQLPMSLDFLNFLEEKKIKKLEEIKHELLSLDRGPQALKGMVSWANMTTAWAYDPLQS